MKWAEVARFSSTMQKTGWAAKLVGHPAKDHARRHGRARRAGLLFGLSL